MSKHIKPYSFMKNRYSAYSRRKRGFSWYWVAIITVMTVFVVLLIAQNSSDTALSMPSDFKVEVNGAPRVAVKFDTIDHGDQHYNIPVESVFSIGNIGDQPLEIIGQPRVEVLEGCCPPRAVVSSEFIRPGEQALLKMTYSMHAGMDGKHHFLVHVRTNDPVEPEKLLHAYSNWIP
jgi:hypothetical protein